MSLSIYVVEQDGVNSNIYHSLDFKTLYQAGLRENKNK